MKRNHYRDIVIIPIALFLSLIISGVIYPQNLLNGPNDVLFDKTNNRYLVANWAGNTIVEIDTAGNQSLYKTNVANAHGMELKNNTLFVASYRSLLLIDINSSATIRTINIPGSMYLGHIAVDSSNYVYITDWEARQLFRVNLNDQSTSTLYIFTERPVGIQYQESNNRLIVLTLGENSPILEYNLADSRLDTVRSTNINDTDAICRDDYGNYYVSSFSGSMVYKFNNDFSGDAEIISTGNGGPSGMGYNSRDNILAVTNYNFNTISLIPLAVNSFESVIVNQISEYLLYQNYPNPFNPGTTFNWQLPIGSDVTLKIFNTLGEEIITLVDEFQQDGNHSSMFIVNSSLPGGVYFYQLKTEGYVETKKMILIK